MSAKWEDTLTFAAPGTVGGIEVVSGSTAGRADIFLDLDGQLFVFDPFETRMVANFSARVSLGACDPLDITCEARTSGRGQATQPDGQPVAVRFLGDVNPDGTPSISRLVIEDYAFTFGSAFDILVEVFAGATLQWSGALPGNVSAAAMFGSTATFGGIGGLEVQDATTGGFVAVDSGDVQLLTSGNVDVAAGAPGETTVIPLPATLPLMLAGFVALGVIRRWPSVSGT